MAERYPNNSSKISCNQSFSMEGTCSGSGRGQCNHRFQFNSQPPQIRHDVPWACPDLQNNTPPQPFGYGVTPPKIYKVCSCTYSYNGDAGSSDMNVSVVSSYNNNGGIGSCPRGLNRKFIDSSQHTFSKRQYSTVTSNPNFSKVVGNHNASASSSYQDSVNSNQTMRIPLNSSQPSTSISHQTETPSSAMKKRRISCQSTCHCTSNEPNGSDSPSLVWPSTSGTISKNYIFGSCSKETLQSFASIKNERNFQKPSCKGFIFDNEKPISTANKGPLYEDKVMSNQQNSNPNRCVKQENFDNCRQCEHICSNTIKNNHSSEDFHHQPDDADLPANEEQYFVLNEKNNLQSSGENVKIKQAPVFFLAASENGRNSTDEQSDTDSPANGVQYFMLNERNNLQPRSVNVEIKQPTVVFLAASENGRNSTVEQSDTDSPANGVQYFMLNEKNNLQSRNVNVKIKQPPVIFLAASENGRNSNDEDSDTDSPANGVQYFLLNERNNLQSRSVNIEIEQAPVVFLAASENGRNLTDEDSDTDSPACFEEE